MDKDLQYDFIFAEYEVVYKKKTAKKMNEIPKVLNSLDGCNVLRPLYTDILSDEYSYALYLNSANRVISWQFISKGSSSSTIIDPPVVLRKAILCNAKGIIISHNHPSGNLKPSAKDIDITKTLKSACNVHNINLLDHIIITEDSFYSLADEGLL